MISGTPPPGQPGPLRLVLAALRDGAPTLDAVRARTGLDRGVVDAAVSYLVRGGYVAVTRLALGCANGCGGCPTRRDCADGRGAGGQVHRVPGPARGVANGR